MGVGMASLSEPEGRDEPDEPLLWPLYASSILRMVLVEEDTKDESDSEAELLQIRRMGAAAGMLE